MISWKFWPEKEFSDVYENIYIRTFVEDWFHITEALAQEIDGKEYLLDVGCGEGHTTKQILDRLNNAYVCDLLEPNAQTLTAARDALSVENTVGKLYPTTLKDFVPERKYDAVFTSHTNYYWADNSQEYDVQLLKLVEIVKDHGKVCILTLPEDSDHYKIMLRSIYPAYDFAEYVTDFYLRHGFNTAVREFKMRFYVGDFFSTKSLFDVKVFYCFVHAQDSYPSDAEARAFKDKIAESMIDGYIDFKDRLIVVTK